MPPEVVALLALKQAVAPLALPLEVSVPLALLLLVPVWEVAPRFGTMGTGGDAACWPPEACRCGAGVFLPWGWSFVLPIGVKDSGLPRFPRSAGRISAFTGPSALQVLERFVIFSGLLW